MPEFVVAIRAGSAVCFPEDEPWLEDGREADQGFMGVRSIYERGAPRFLEAWLVGEAADADEAGRRYSEALKKVLTLLSVGTNAAIHDEHLGVVYQRIDDGSPYRMDVRQVELYARQRFA